MKVAQLHITGVSPYSQSRFHATPKLDKELADDYEKRTWKEKGHYDDKGYMVVPPMVWANCIKEAAKYLSIRIPTSGGKGTFTKHFEAGILVTEFSSLGIHKEGVHQNWVFCNADGVRGSGKRVMRAFPTVLKWETDATVYILDSIITRPVFETVLEAAGNLIGIGQFRPRNGGYFGRFKAEVIAWKED